MVVNRQVGEKAENISTLSAIDIGGVLKKKGGFIEGIR